MLEAKMLRQPLKLAGILCLLFAVSRLSFSFGETWHNCTSDSCKAFFVNFLCDNTACICGAPTSNQSTCSIPSSTFNNHTGLQSNHSQQCCLCQTNQTFCCRSCPLPTSAQISPTPVQLPISPTMQGTSPPPCTAFLSAVFILECDKYSASKNRVSQSFSHVIGSLTNTNIDVENITCSTGAGPYCGVNVTGLEIKEKTVHVSSGACNSMTIKATMKSIPSTVRQQVQRLQLSTQLGNLSIQLWDATTIKVSFLITHFNSSSILHQRFTTSPLQPTTARKIPPIETNFWPLIYSAIGVGSLIFLCIVWQCAKQSYLLRKKKYTDINSNRVNSHKKKVEEAMENRDSMKKKDQTPFDMTHRQLQDVDNDALTRRYDWTTPGYLPSMLAPAYPPTQRHSAPRLILDDDDSEVDQKSIGKASVVNVDEETDEDLKEILESEDEEDFRTSTRQSYVSAKKSLSIPNNRKQSTTSKTSHSKRNSSAKSTSKIPTPSDKQSRKPSYSGPDGAKSPSFGNLKSNRITPIDNVRKPSVSSLKPKKTNDSKI